MKNKRLEKLIDWVKEVSEKHKTGYLLAIEDLLEDYACELCDVWTENNFDDLHQKYIISKEENGETGDPDYYCDIELDEQRVRDHFTMEFCLDFNDWVSKVIDTIEEIEFEIYNKVHTAFEKIGFYYDKRLLAIAKKSRASDMLMEYRASRGE